MKKTPSPPEADLHTAPTNEKTASVRSKAVAASQTRRNAAKKSEALSAKKEKPTKTGVVARPVATRVESRPRHWGLILALLVIVVLPVAIASWYLYARAADQYASTVAFTVRTEEFSSPVDFLGGLGGALRGGGGSSDADILYEFIRSQEMVASIDEQLDLRILYTLRRDTDPLLSFNPDGTIEDLTAFWQRMVRVSYDSGTGLMKLRVLAFEPNDATAIAEAIFDESVRMINALSAIAREDATRYAREDLEASIEKVKAAREELTAFRVTTQIVDPTADVLGQVGLLNTLQAQLAEALIELDLLGSSTREGDPRVDQAKLRVEVIQARIAQERQKFGAGAPGDTSYATTIAGFERLSVEREFAEQAYAVALSNFDRAIADANRNSRYLAAHIQPTTAERAEFPQRALILGAVALFSFLFWAIASLFYYSLRDRR